MTQIQIHRGAYLQPDTQHCCGRVLLCKKTVRVGGASVDEEGGGRKKKEKRKETCWKSMWLMGELPPVNHT